MGQSRPQLCWSLTAINCIGVRPGSTMQSFKMAIGVAKGDLLKVGTSSNADNSPFTTANFTSVGPFDQLTRGLGTYENHQLNERSHRKIVGQQISHLQSLSVTVRLGVLRTLLERLMHSRGRHAQLR